MFLIKYLSIAKTTWEKPVNLRFILRDEPLVLLGEKTIEKLYEIKIDTDTLKIESFKEVTKEEEYGELGIEH